MTSFETGVTVLGALLVVGALMSGIARRSFLSLTAVFVLVGMVLGHGGLEVLQIDPRSAFVQDLALTALVLILFRDGLEVEAEMLQRAWRLPLRKLVLAMPITAGIVAVATKALTDLTWTEAFLVGALLSPTDPVLSSSVVTNPRVPRVIRHSLNLESGLNDGLALPPVLALTAALSANHHFVWWKFVLQDVTLGVVYGLVVGYLASRLLPRGSAMEESIPPHQRALYALGVAFLTYGLTTLPPHGNGVIAVFVCAIVLGIRRPDVRRYFESRAEDIIEIVKLGVFVVFGSLLTLGGLFGDGWAAVGVVAVTLLVARTAAVWVALAGTRLDAASKAFMAWFGPKGVATMTFSLLVLGAAIPHAERIFNLAALVVVCSVVVHGLTDTPGAEWIARHAARAEREPEPEPASA
ncbi:MAG: sodium/hydrogen antiporter [Solirubrobacteraceae bacterium]|jgi:NhaP-type Na+/H+ or K+/H+ antiporter|nr:sodium/hydrogen antiporter [Solirubrobacteraceae bacterium]MEA2277356.1 sodium/hydrogen antiporter [Solirubrobacteraceae bacterium]MEA2393376.1 sodium/hydrogen antiporter [Solirubrobacteraceae bacterium]